MILKLLAPLAAVSVAYAIPASLRGARTGRALTEETPKDDEAPAADRLLRPEVSSPCADLLALCAKYKLAGPVCNTVSSNCDAMSEFFEEPEDDAEMITIPMAPAVPPIIDITLPGGFTFKGGVNVELGEGSQPGSIAGKVEGGVEGGIDPAQNILGFGIGGGLAAGASGESGIGGELGPGGVGLDAYIQGSSGAGVGASANLMGAFTNGESSAMMEGSSTFNATADPGGANVVGAASGSAGAGTSGVTNAFGMDVIGGGAAAGAEGQFSSDNTLVINNETVSASVVDKATGEAGVSGGVTVMGQSQTLGAGVGGAVHNSVENSLTPSEASAAVDLNVNGTLTFEAAGDLLDGTEVINVPIVDVGFDVTVP